MSNAQMASIGFCITYVQMADGPWKHRPEFLPCLVVYTIAFLVSNPY